jgi:hypothetical protein
MLGWQLATIIVLLGISQLLLSIAYFRPKEISGKYKKSKISVWKLIFIAAVMTIFFGGVLLLLPENLWWTH